MRQTQVEIFRELTAELRRYIKPSARDGYTLHHAMKAAVEAGRLSPCAKSQRGVVIFSSQRLISAAFNSPPFPEKCTDSMGCFAHCGQRALHAEEGAILTAMEEMEYEDWPALSMVHVKVKDKKLVTSGPPSCWQCSKQILAVGLKGIWLLHESGSRFYEPEEFHRRTLEECDLLGHAG